MSARVPFKTCHFVWEASVLLTYEKRIWSKAAAAVAAAVASLQSCPTLCNPIDGLLPGSSVPGILQARTLEWVAISFFSVWKWKVKVKSLSHVWLLGWIQTLFCPFLALRPVTIGSFLILGKMRVIMPTLQISQKDWMIRSLKCPAHNNLLKNFLLYIGV